MFGFSAAFEFSPNQQKETATRMEKVNLDMSNWDSLTKGEPKTALTCRADWISGI